MFILGQIILEVKVLTAGIWCLGLVLLGIPSMAQVFEIDTLRYRGDSDHKVDMVIIGDGYTTPELDKFKADAENFISYFFSEKPFIHYEDYFNVFIIKVPSNESGVKHAHEADDCPEPHPHNTGTDTANFSRDHFVPRSNPDNYFGSSFDNHGLHRLVIAHNEKAIEDVLDRHIPTYDQALILVNSPYYGGSGGRFPTSTVNIASNDIAIHELGHSFGALNDEYWAGVRYLSETTNQTQSATAETVPWKAWIGTDGVGVYSYGPKAPQSVWYRPHEFCKMQYLVAPFCAVCSETLVSKIHQLTNPIDYISLDTSMAIPVDSLHKLKVKVTPPHPNTLKIVWTLNGKPIDTGTSSPRIDVGMLDAGENLINVKVTDTTALVRSIPHPHYDLTWRVVNDTIAMLRPPKIQWGDTVEVCHGSPMALSVAQPVPNIMYHWYTDSAGGFPVFSGSNVTTPALYQQTTFFVEAEWERQVTARTPVTVKVLPEIAPPDPSAIEVSKDRENDVIFIKINHPQSDYTYRWYTSADSRQPFVNAKNRRDMDGVSIGAGGRELRVPMDIAAKEYYVEAVSMATTCTSERIRVRVKR